MEYQARLANRRLKCDKARPRSEQLTIATNAVGTTCLRHAGLILEYCERERMHAVEKVETEESEYCLRCSTVQGR